MCFAGVGVETYKDGRSPGTGSGCPDLDDFWI
uniref:Uncharacterized protein n=1 Tax=Anguilla anguilla TaxID=7936 RepID=A0A0E9U7H1_ANGAN